LFWDGDVPESSYSKNLQYQAQGVEYTPSVYGGWTQYCLWILVPRVAREWRANDDMRESWRPYFAQIIAAVERVHLDPVLTRFWRKGELVPNLSRPHPFNFEIPAKWADTPRWYHLATNLDPALPAPDLVRHDHFTKRFPVWTLARVVGTKPNREWLVYAHAPLGDQGGVRVTIPDYQDIVLSRVAVGGTFYHVKEFGRTVTEVGLAAGPLRSLLRPAPPADVEVQ
jgi:hypothetical protein